MLSVESGSPAAKARLEQGDVIIAMGDDPVSGVDDLHRYMTDERIGAPSALTVMRRGIRRQLAVVPAESQRR